MTAERSLRRQAFDDKYAALGRALPQRLDRGIGWRIVPGARFLRTVESDHHDRALGRFAFERLDFVASNHVVGIERRQGFWNLGCVFLNGRKIVHFDLGDEVAGRCLSFRLNRPGSGNPDRDPSQSCESHLVVRFHKLVLLDTSQSKSLALSNA